jgi:hypothetical protein
VGKGQIPMTAVLVCCFCPELGAFGCAALSVRKKKTNRSAENSAPLLSFFVRFLWNIFLNPFPVFLVPKTAKTRP